MEQRELKERNTKAGFVALLGFTNAGKSTLMNRLVKQKISIVTHKVQTTRMSVRGIVMAGKTQVVFVDMPGIFLSEKIEDKHKVNKIWKEAENSDLILVLLDAQSGLKRIEHFFPQIAAIKKRKILVLNKIDKIKSQDLLILTQEANKAVSFDATFMVSALTGSGCDDLLEKISAMLPEGPWLYEEDQVSDLSLRQLCAEITREKMYLRLHKELPYLSSVETVKWEEKKGSVKIYQEIRTERESHKKMIIGHAGEVIRNIGQSARLEIESLLEKKVSLFLFVKIVKKDKHLLV